MKKTTKAVRINRRMEVAYRAIFIPLKSLIVCFTEQRQPEDQDIEDTVNLISLACWVLHPSWPDNPPPANPVFLTMLERYILDATVTDEELEAMIAVKH